MQKTVLLVDDNDDERYIYSTLLRSFGYEVLLTDKGEEALRVARETSPDLIVMDVWLPEMSGLTASRRLREDPATSTIPIIAISLYDVSPAAVRDAGCDMFLEKPFTPANLRAAVERYVGPPLQHR
jgi:two-component system, cell cycle response regulator DivK